MQSLKYCISALSTSHEHTQLIPADFTLLKWKLQILLGSRDHTNIFNIWKKTWAAKNQARIYTEYLVLQIKQKLLWKGDTYQYLW